MEMLPKGRLFRPTFADPREVRMALSFEGDAKINAAVGNYFSLFAVQQKEEDGWKHHVGLEGGGFFTMRQQGGRFPLETADGLIGFYVDSSKGSWAWQLRFTHISAHLADGSVDIPIAYSREFLAARFGWFPDFEKQIYIGAQMLTNSTPALPAWTFQLGGAYFLPWGFDKLAPFVAMDLKWRSESLTQFAASMQLGLALNNPPEAYRSFRFFYAFYTGANPRGQFYNRSYTSHSFGIEMQI